MIFVAVGTQFPFDRLIRCVDEWAKQQDIAVSAQIATGTYLPEHIKWQRFMPTESFNEQLKQSTLLISHAGMGNIITALEYQKPIIVMNRQAELGEHRNNHQAEGLQWMKKLPGVYTAEDCTGLLHWLNQHESLSANTHQGQWEKRQALIRFIDQAIAS